MPSSHSPSSYIKSQMARATNLEAQLAAHVSEEEASRIRIQLCEVLSDVILTSPEHALRKDCFGRMWRNCFYARIGELRSRISRERRKNGASLKKLEAILKQFLKEAITLYKYLVEKYESKLLPSPSQESEEPTPTTTTDGVVPGLHRILIHLGDLYRYSCSYSKAEDCYQRASKLAPSKGNPYNQLAVVAQLKDTSAPLSCVALYYYARSLLATHDPFESSKANLERLLESNREWLQSTSEQALLDEHCKTYAQKVEKSRAIRSVQSRLFLARFVDLHYDFFRGMSFSERQTRDTELVDKMNTLISKLDALLKEWAFGDSLLVKMVVINAFSIHWTQSKTLARSFMLRFGASLAERLEHGLRKAMEKNTPSVRLLMPLVLLCDYVSTWTHEDDSPDTALGSQARDFCVDAKHRYWTRIASVASQLLPLRNSLSLDEMHSSDIRLRDYDNLCGFAPFDTFVNTSESDQVYLSVDDAIRVLELASSTQASDKSTSAEENPIKLKRFFDIVDTMVEKKQPICCVNGQYRVFSPKTADHDSIVEDDDEDDMMDQDDPVVEFESSEVEIEKEPVAAVPKVLLPEDGVLEYKQSEGGAGPALLVPGALLLNKSQEITPLNAKQDRSAAVITTNGAPSMVLPSNAPQQKVMHSNLRLATNVTMTEQAAPATAPLGPPPGILPPPGFGAPAAPAPGFGAQPPPQPPLQPPPMMGGFPAYPSSQTLPDGDTVLQMLRGMDTNTANPFMISSTVTRSRLFPSQQSFNDMDEQDVDGMSLLDSSLLSSMMMDDGNSQPRSRNPFLT